MATQTTTTTARKSRKPARAAVKSRKPLPTANVTQRRIGGTTADVSDYVRAKTANGHVSLNNGDPVARKLEGKTLDDAYAFAAKATGLKESELRTRYKHLNPGMQRMNLGNIARGALQ